MGSSARDDIANKRARLWTRPLSPVCPRKCLLSSRQARAQGCVGAAGLSQAEAVPLTLSLTQNGAELGEVKTLPTLAATDAATT